MKGLTRRPREWHRGSWALMRSCHPFFGNVCQSALKQEFMETQKARWLKAWMTSLCFARSQHRDSAFPFNKFQKIISILSRSKSSLLIQLQMGHIPINSYLHCIKKSDTRCCANCCDAGRRSIIEMVIYYLCWHTSHVLLCCLLYYIV